MENQVNVGEQNAQQIGQNPVSHPVQVPKKPKVNYWMISTVLLVVILVLGGLYIYKFASNQSSRTLQPQNTPTATTSQISQANQTEKSITVSKWPKVNLNNTIVFYGQKEIDLGSPTGENIRPFNNEITQNMNYIYQVFVSPDKNKILFGQKEPSKIAYLTSSDGALLEKIDITKIKDYLGKQYEISIKGWSLDSNKLILYARDTQNFLDDRCCDGGDYRASKQIIATYDIDSHEIKEIFSVTRSMISPIFFDSNKNILVYYAVLGENDKNYYVDLNSKKELTFNSLINDGGNKTYFVAEKGDKRHLAIYSIYQPTTSITEITLDGPQNNVFYERVNWSPDNQYFAIRVDDKDNSFGDPLKIYDNNGKLILSTNSSLNGGDMGYVFSSDNKYLFSSYNYDVGGGIYKFFWEAINISNDEKYINKFSSPDIGSAIFWFK